MITEEEITLLDTPEIRQLIEANIERNPNSIALDKRLPHAGMIASQVKYLQRAAKKLRSYYNVRAIIPSLAFEQSSSEATAARKSWKGDTCIDLTCGLGVDAYYLSKGFDKVITIEQNPQLAAVARINFSRLGAENITVVNSTAEEFLHNYHTQSGRADMIYADPDRRSAEGRKLVRLEDCSPDITALLPMLRQITDKLAVKLSPLFDVAEIFRIFGNGTTADVVSLGGECKEVIAEWSANSATQTVKASVIGIGEAQYAYDCEPKQRTSSFTPPYRYIIIPDVALRKARITSAYFAERLPEAYVTPGDGYVFADSLSPSPLPDTTDFILGRVFEVVYMEKYDPKKLKIRLKEKSIKGIEIYTHNFPHSAPELARRLNVREGGGIKVAFTSIGTELWVIGLK